MAIWYVNPGRKRRVRKNPKRRLRARRNPKRQIFARGKNGKRLYGAAAKAKLKSLRKKARKNPTMKRRRRRNPAGRPKGAAWTHAFSGIAKAHKAEQRELKRAHRKAKKRKRSVPANALSKIRSRLARKYRVKRKVRKGTSMAKRKSAKRVAAGRKAARTRAAKRAKRSAAAKRAARKRKVGSTKKRAKRVGGKRKSAKRVRAGKKAARTRARRRGRKMAKKTRRRSRRRFKGMRALKRARRTIKRARSKRGGRRARAYVRHYRMRTNPGTSGVVGVVSDVIKNALPVAAGFYASRVLTAQAGKVDMLNKLGHHRDPVVSLGVVAGLAYLTGKVTALNKYKSQLLVGAGMAVVDVLLKTYLPSVAGQLGVGEYLNMGEYIEYPGMGGFDYELGEYMEELGDYPSQIATAPQGHQLAAAAEYGDVSQTDLYSGVFAGSMIS